MLLRRMITAVFLVLFLSSCSANPLESLLQTPEPTVDATKVFQSALQTVTWGIPTHTPQPTSTPAPTATLRPIETFTPVPTPQPLVISKDNIKDLNVTQRIGESAVIDMVFSPDSSKLLVLSASQLTLFDAASGKRLWHRDSGKLFIRAYFTPDGTKIRTLTAGGGIQEWKADSGSPNDWLFDIQPKIALSVLSATTNRLMLTNFMNEATVFDTEGFKKVGQFPRSNLAYGIMETTMTSSGDHILMYGWHTDSEPLAMMFKSKDWSFNSLAGATAREFNFTISGDDKRIASLRNLDDNDNLMDSSVLSMWPVDDFKLYVRLNFKGTARQVALSPDGNTVYLVMDNEKRIGVVDVEKARTQYFKDINANTHTPYELDWIEGHSTPLHMVKTSADGKRLASCDELGQIKIWDSGSKQSTADLQNQNSIAPNAFTSVGLLADRRMFARTSIDQTRIELVDGRQGTIIKTFSGNNGNFYSAVSLSPDGSRLSAVEITGSEAYKLKAPQKLVVWDVGSGNQVFNMPSGHIQRILQTRISANNQFLASVSHGQLFVWDIKNAVVKNALGGYSACDFSPDSQHILYDNADYGVYITDINSSKLLNFQRAEYIRALAYAPGGLTAAVGAWSLVDINEDLVFYMDTQPPYQKKTQVINNLRSGVDFLAYSPDGKLLATLDSYGTLYINDTQTGAELKRLDNMVDPAAMTFTGDGSVILIGSADGSVLVVEAAHPPAPAPALGGLLE
jgi:WD40 repeat protein